MKLLAIDAGNTRVKWALHDGESWAEKGSAPTQEVRSHGLTLAIPHVQHIVVSNVAGDQVREALVSFANLAGAPMQVIESLASACGITNAYREPQRLGTDRWAALVGARHLFPGHEPTLVILAGTALTVDAIDASGQHLGGIIVPGESLMQTALTQGTAQLREDLGAAPPFPASTAEAISRGVMDALAGAIERFRQRTVEHCGDAPTPIGQGGALAALIPNLPFPVAIHDNLIFEGLRALAQHLNPKS